jgi:hypothetical protein
MMNQATIRTIFRWIHIVFAIPIIGYVYSPFDQIPNYARPTRFVFVPLLALSGLWMWKGHVVPAACFEKIGVWHRFVLEPMIFDRQFPTAVAGHVGRS